jgi:DNA-binding SARP family transcriptional activator
MTRRGLAADSWREDLLQSVLRLAMASGQRSAGIEVYTSVRKRLAEDLGIDPSKETMQLYEQLIAMDESERYSNDQVGEGLDGDAP